REDLPGASQWGDGGLRRVQLSRCNPAVELVQQTRVPRQARLLARPVAPVDADDHPVAQLDDVGRQPGDLAGGEPDDADPAASAQRAQGALCCRAAHWIDDDIRATARVRTDLILEVVVPDGVRRSMAQCECALLLRR